MPHAALWVVQPLKNPEEDEEGDLFQCRTRLCGWCSGEVYIRSNDGQRVSMPHAALWVVQLRRSQLLSP